ncbi:MAG: radical SAM protein [Bacteroidales bacterium]
MILSYKNWFFDKIRLLSVLSPGRLINYSLIIVGYSLSRLFKKTILIGYPFSLSFETSSVCNLSCPQCPAGRKETKRTSSFIKKEIVTGCLKEFQKKSFYTNLYLQGEPLLNPELPDLIKKAKALHYYTFVSTNGTLVTKDMAKNLVNSGLDKIIISVDGIRQSTYSFYRKKGDLEVVKRGIQNIISARKSLKKRNPLVVMQFLVNKENEREISDLGAFAKNLMIDQLNLKSMQIYDHREDFLPGIKRYNRYYKKKRKNNGACFRLWSHLVLTSDGVCIPCCYDKIPSHSFSKESHGYMSIWKSEAFNDFREKTIKNRKAIDICSNCDE